LLDPAARLVVAHRGASAEAPENTMAAFERAVALGADAVELDVHCSADGQVVVLHDATLDRTTTARGPVAARTAAELATLGVPRLADVLAAWPTLPLLVEVKVAAASGALARLLREQRAVERCVVASEHDDAMLPFRAPPFLAGATRRDIVRLVVAPLLGTPRSPAYRLLSVPWRHRGIDVPTAGFIRRAGALGAAVSVWTVDDPTLATQLLARGANGVLTNDPRRLLPLRPGRASARTG
jgi:glycerophosphoryl diester phosphodiesterase